MAALGATVNRNSLRTSAEAQIVVARIATVTSCAARCALSISVPLPRPTTVCELPQNSAFPIVDQLWQRPVQSHLVNRCPLLVGVHHHLLGFLVIRVSLGRF